MSEEYTVNELYKILGALIDDGYGNKEFQLYYDGESSYTSIPKGSRILIFSHAVRFTDYDDKTYHIDNLEEILNEVR